MRLGIKLFIFTFCFLINNKVFSETLIDLERDFIKDFVIESKRIKIPGYPNAFNPSIINWRDSILMSFRVIPERRHSFNSYIGLVFLDKNFNPIDKPQILNFRRGLLLSSPSRAEDARLIKVGKKLYMIYSDNTDTLLTKKGFRVYVAELEYNGKLFSIKSIECLKQFENCEEDRREKNWVPFVYKGNLLFAYSLVPHKILKPFLGTGVCETFATSLANIGWSYGEPRGGTPALLEGDSYLSFFHSSLDMPSCQSQGKTVSHYFMGAYTFSTKPPFQLTKISPDPIVGKKYYNGNLYKPYWKPVRVVFPCGFISNSQYIWIAYGRQDHESWVTKLNKKALLDSLVPIEEVQNILPSSGNLH